MDLIAYLRISTKEQLKGWGLDTQEELVTEWAKNNGHNIVKIYREVESGTASHDDRTVLDQVLVDLEDGLADGMLIPKHDRFARTLVVQEATLGYIWRMNKKVFGVLDGGEIPEDDINDPLRTAMRQMMGVFAELERRTILKRMWDGIRTKQSQGKKATGSYAYGMRGAGVGRDRDAAPDPLEQEAVKLMTKLRRKGVSYRQICDSLTTAGYKTKRGGPWRPYTVQKILEQKKYKAKKPVSGSRPDLNREHSV